MKSYFKVLFLIIVFLCSVLGLQKTVLVASGIPTKGDVVATQPAPANVDLSKDEVARRVESTLRNAKYLEVTTLVFDNAPRLSRIDDPCYSFLKPVVLKSEMAPEALLTFGYVGGEPVSAFSLLNGQYVEFQTCQPRGEGNPKHYKAPIPNGTDDLDLGSPDNCLMGNHIYSWVGVPQENGLPLVLDTAGSMRYKIDKGVREDDVVAQGHDCYVFRVENPGPQQLQDVVYVDKKTFLVRVWVTVYPTYQRVRMHDIKIMDHVPEGIDWEIHPDALPPLVLK